MRSKRKPIRRLVERAQGNVVQAWRNAVKTGRRLRRPSDALIELQMPLLPGAKPARDLVVHPEKGSANLFDNSMANAFIRALSKMPAGPMRTRRLRQLAAEIATRPHFEFQKIRERYRFIDVDGSGRVWFSNTERPGSVELKARGQDWSTALAELGRTPVKSEAYRNTLFRFAKYALSATIGLEALTPTVLHTVRYGINALDRDQLAGIHNQIIALEGEQRSFEREIFGAYSKPGLTATERANAAQKAQNNFDRIGRQIEALKTGPGQSQLNVNRRIQARDRALEHTIEKIRPFYRFGPNAPYVPVAPALIAAALVAARRNRLEFGDRRKK